MATLTADFEIITTMEVIKQGAEAKLYLGEYNGEHCLIKERFQKKYRHPELDAQITKQRMKAEAKTAARCLAAGIHAPTIYHMNLRERTIYMEYFPNAITVKQYITNIAVEFEADEADKQLERICLRIGDMVGRMHAHNIVHGDLTTSNMLVEKPKDDGSELDVILIDFGLSFYAQSVEDKAVDLYVLERALLSAHSEQVFLFDNIMRAYRNSSATNLKAVLSKFEEVRQRGRKRTMVG